MCDPVWFIRGRKYTFSYERHRLCVSLLIYKRAVAQVQLAANSLELQMAMRRIRI